MNIGSDLFHSLQTIPQKSTYQVQRTPDNLSNYEHITKIMGTNKNKGLL